MSHANARPTSTAAACWCAASSFTIEPVELAQWTKIYSDFAAQEDLQESPELLEHALCPESLFNGDFSAFLAEPAATVAEAARALLA